MSESDTDALDLTGVWESVREGLKARMSLNEFSNWIAPLGLRGISGEVATLQVPVRFLGNWIETHYKHMILEEFSSRGFAVKSLDFIVFQAADSAGIQAAGDSQAAPGPLAAASPAAPGPGNLVGSALNPRFTFESFVVGSSNDFAYSAAVRMADSKASVHSYNPLFFYGGVGLGKTHLMHAIGWRLLGGDSAVKFIYLTAENFMNVFVSALRSRDMISFKEPFRTADVLMVDDIQFMAGKDRTQDEFFHTFNSLIEQNKRIILSADKVPGDIEGLQERVKSRLQCGVAVDLHPADFELRLGILQQKSEELLDGRDVRIPGEVLELMARRITKNVRLLEGALNRLVAFSEMTRAEITVENATSCLKDMFRQSARRLTADQIISEVAGHYRVRVADIHGPRRSAGIVLPRQVAMYLVKDLTSKSLPEIGRCFGNRDHTTVLHAMRKVEGCMGSDSLFAEEVARLRQSLESGPARD